MNKKCTLRRGGRRGVQDEAERHLAVQTLHLLPAAARQLLPLAVDGGEEQLGVGQQGVSPLQVPPKLLLHVKVSVAHLHRRQKDSHSALKRRVQTLVKVLIQLCYFSESSKVLNT